MENKKLSQREIAQLFSNGKFETTFPYLSENVIWIVIGESETKGKQDLIANCRKISEYFNSVETVFITKQVISANNKVVVTCSGEFIKDGRRINLVSACDVYEFGEGNLVKCISSYCINEQLDE